MSTKTKLFSASLILAASLMTAGVGQALAEEFEMGRESGPQDNRCWGEGASALAQSAKAGMGRHSRSEMAPGDTFRDAINPRADGDPSRSGIGNGTRGAPHNEEPSSGGLGEHALTNSNFFTEFLDPVDGSRNNPAENNDLITSERCKSLATDSFPNGDVD